MLGEDEALFSKEDRMAPKPVEIISSWTSFKAEYFEVSRCHASNNVEVG